jgi:hypothetical protein
MELGECGSAQQNVCAMVAGRHSIKYIYLTTFSHADSGGFEKPPLRKHKRWWQAVRQATTLSLSTN